jgi:hypothetical protein
MVKSCQIPRKVFETRHYFVYCTSFCLIGKKDRPLTPRNLILTLLIRIYCLESRKSLCDACTKAVSWYFVLHNESLWSWPFAICLHMFLECVTRHKSTYLRTSYSNKLRPDQLGINVEFSPGIYDHISSSAFTADSHSLSSRLYPGIM